MQDPTAKPCFTNAKRNQGGHKPVVITFQRLLTVKAEVVTPGETEADRAFSNIFKHSFTEDSPLATRLASHNETWTKGCQGVLATEFLRNTTLTGMTKAAREFSKWFKQSFAKDSPLATSLSPNKDIRTKGMPRNPRDLIPKGYHPTRTRTNTEAML